MIGSDISCIKRFYVGDWLGARGGTIGIFVATSLSDHVLIILVLEKVMQVNSCVFRTIWTPRESGGALDH